MTTLVQAVDTAVTQATQRMAALPGDPAVAAANQHMQSWTNVRNQLVAGRDTLVGINLETLLPDQAAAALAALKAAQTQLDGARGAAVGWAQNVTTDIRAITGELDAVSSQEAGVEADLRSLMSQISDLERQVAAARERQRDESYVPILGPIISGLDNLIDNLVNQTNEKSRQAQALQMQAVGDEQRIGQLRLQAQSLQLVGTAVSAVLTPLDTLAAGTANVVSKVAEVNQMARDADGLDVLVKATLGEWQDTLSVVAQIVG